MTDPTQDALIARTIDHYSALADSFWQGTKDHDVDQNRAALLEELATDAHQRVAAGEDLSLA